MREMQSDPGLLRNIGGKHIDPSVMQNTPLLLASSCGRWGVVKELLRDGRVTGRYEGMTRVMDILIDYYKKLDVSSRTTTTTTIIPDSTPPSIPEFISSLGGGGDYSGIAGKCVLNYEYMRAFVKNEKIVKTHMNFGTILRRAIDISCENDDLRYLIFLLDLYEKETKEEVDGAKTKKEFIDSRIPNCCRKGSISTGLHLLMEYGPGSMDLVESLENLCGVPNKGTGLITALLDGILKEEQQQEEEEEKKEWIYYHLLFCVSRMSRCDELNGNLKEFLSHLKVKRIVMTYEERIRFDFKKIICSAADVNNRKIVKTLTRACTSFGMNLDGRDRVGVNTVTRT